MQKFPRFFPSFLHTIDSGGMKMCTALTFKTKSHYFGRNLDLECSLGEQVVITPRNFALNFRMLPTLEKHFSIIGVAKIDNGYPLYYDATNEAGLSIAGLNFPDTAIYLPIDKNKQNVAPFEIIPYLLGRFENVTDVINFLKDANIADISYSEKFPQTPLHWIIADKNKAIVVEPLNNGIRIYDNTIGVLTNNPEFSFQMLNLNNYANLSAKGPEESFSENLPFFSYSNGLGGLGLPGDFSSMSRFVRAVFAKFLSVCDSSEESSVAQFFHILSYVKQVRGCVKVKNMDEFTIYSSCCNIDTGVYYYNTYQNSNICRIDMHRQNLDSDVLIPFEMIKKQTFFCQN